MSNLDASLPSSKPSIAKTEALALASAADVQLQSTADPLFAAFLIKARRDGGIDPQGIEPRLASYRVALAHGDIHCDLRFGSRIGGSAASTTVADLLQLSLSVPRDCLIHAAWQAKDLAELRALMVKLRATVRYAHDPRGGLLGHLVMATAVTTVIDVLESGEQMLPICELALDAITRNLGLRSKVTELSHIARSHSPDGSNEMDRGNRIVRRTPTAGS